MKKELGKTYLWSLLIAFVSQLFIWGLFIFFDENPFLNQDFAETIACISSIVLQFIAVVLLLVFEKKLLKKINSNSLPFYIFFFINWCAFSILGGILTLKLVDLNILHYCDSSVEGSLFGPCFLNGIEYLFEAFFMLCAIVLLIIIRVIILIIKCLKRDKIKVRNLIKENLGKVVLIVSIVVILIILAIINSLELDKKYYLNALIKNGDEFITYDDSTIIVDGIMDTKFTKSTILIDYDSKTVGFLMSRSIDEFLFYKLEEGNCVNGDRYLQREFELNNPGLSFKTFYKEEELSHRTNDLLLIMQDGTEYSSCNIKDYDGDSDPFLGMN